ncbi:MAG: hypothetical protein JHC95_22140, partial [Solirubrobacteraceae bacterium]|nr:hypothetical protein [Solirubrobacteraceae bacterium]
MRTLCLIPILLLLAVPAAAGAATHTGTCTEPDGLGFRVTYQSDVPGPALVQVSNLQSKAPSSSTWTNFADFWGDVTNLTWWTPGTATPFMGSADPHPAVTLYGAGNVDSF